MSQLGVAVLLLLLLASCAAAGSASVKPLNASVFYDASHDVLSVKTGVIDPEHAVAFGSFIDGLNVTGWGVLELKTSSSFPDPLQMRAAGMLEGYLTAARIVENHVNLLAVFFGDAPPSQAYETFFQKQRDWTSKTISKYVPWWSPDMSVQRLVEEVEVQSSAKAEEGKLSTAGFWNQVALVQEQLKGLMQGYNAAASEQGLTQLSMFDFQLLQATGDLLDLTRVIEPERRPAFGNMSRSEVEDYLFRTNHCSGLVKIAYDYSDLFVAHSSWFTYSAMNRIFKSYFLDLASADVAAKKMTFSSYPGFLVSLDDFYQMDSNLAMIQTTNSIMNQTLYDLIKPESLLAWQRVRVANSASRTGAEWADLIGRNQSGTYTNQYLLIDYNLFQPGQPLVPNTLWAVEQIPGLTVSADVTRELERGYFPSYNVPYFIEVFNISGYPSIVAKYGPEMSYQLAPRAQIFRRLQTDVNSLESLRTLMRYNNYTQDPVANGNPTHTICARGDLRSSDPSPSGCYDTKVTNAAMHKTLSTHAINGPTTSGDLPAFSWAKFPTRAHDGMPQVFDFDFIDINPTWQW